MKIKICGITRLQDALTAVEYGADAIGFIFYENSKRYISPEHAKEIISKLPFFVHKVGVFVNEDSERVNYISKEVGLTAVQLHGDETPDYIQNISVPLIKAFRVDPFFNYNILYRYKETPILLDAYSSSDYGGTGIKFSWENIPSEFKNNIILAGGISDENLEKISIEINPQAIDVSSSIEDNPGIKNKNKMIKLLKKINEIRK